MASPVRLPTKSIISVTSSLRARRRVITQIVISHSDKKLMCTDPVQVIRVNVRTQDECSL